MYTIVRIYTNEKVLYTIKIITMHAVKSAYIQEKTNQASDGL